MMNRVFLSLGSNLGDRISNINKAYQIIEERVGTILKKSSFYSSPPWGFESDEAFINTVILISTQKSAEEVLDILKDIERGLGRKKKTDPTGYHDRIIDLDIIDYNGIVLNTKELILPHPRMEQRDFVLVPLAEIEPNWLHKGKNLPLNDLLKTLPNERFIERLI